jgi:hypothetical protein
MAANVLEDGELAAAGLGGLAAAYDEGALARAVLAGVRTRAVTGGPEACRSVCCGSEVRVFVQETLEILHGDPPLASELDRTQFTVTDPSADRAFLDLEMFGRLMDGQ